MSELEPEQLPADPLLDERPPAPVWGYKELFLLAGLLPVFILIGVAVLMLALMATGVLSGKMAQQSRSAQAWLSLGGQGIGYVLWLFTAQALFQRKFGRSFLAAVDFRKPFDGLVWCLALGPVLAIVVNVLGYLLRTPTIRNPFEDLARTPVQLVGLAVFALFMGPLFEELLFRGLALPLVARDLGTAAGLVFTALPFGLLHGAQYSWQWQYVLIITIVGVVCGWVRLRTRSTMASTATHLAYNAMIFVGLVVTLTQRK